jgi:hypothetical protein
MAHPIGASASDDVVSESKLIVSKQVVTMTRGLSSRLPRWHAFDGLQTRIVGGRVRRYDGEKGKNEC